MRLFEHGTVEYPMISAGKEGLEQPTKPITEAGLCLLQRPVVYEELKPPARAAS